MGTRIFLAAVLLTIASTLLQAQTISRAQLNQGFEIHYGVVNDVNKVKVQSSAPSGAVMGGLIGGATSGHHHRGKHAATGAVAGALLSAVLDGDRRAYQYTVDLVDGGQTKVVIESGGIREGDCVSVELGTTANIRRVSSVHCESPDSEALNDHVTYAKTQSDAAECHAAKNMVLKASSDEEIELAMKKVRVFCE